jgi:hypothetical protein
MKSAEEVLRQLMPVRAGFTWMGLSLLLVACSPGGSSAPDLANPNDGGTARTCTTGQWVPVMAPRGPLWAIWGFAEDDVWIVGGAVAGHDTILLHWDGITWSQSPSGTTLDLYAIWGSRTDNVWVGGPDTLLHWDGKSWSVTYLPGWALGTIWGWSDNNVLTTGAGGIFRYDGKSWTLWTKPPPGVGELWGISPDDVWGWDDIDAIQHWS